MIKDLDMPPSRSECASSSEGEPGSVLEDRGHISPVQTDDYIIESEGAISQGSEQCHLDESIQATSDTDLQQGNETPEQKPYALPRCEASPSKGQEDDTVVNIRSSKRPPIMQSLGRFSCIVIIGGTVSVFPLIGFLLYLWTGKDSERNRQSTPNLWRTIALADWTTRTVALCSLLLRTITAAQAAICTSLVAALLIERHRVPLSKIARLSLARDVNSGSLELFQVVLSRGLSFVSFSLEISLLLAVALASVAIQFSSTILLSDLGTVSLTEYSNTTRHNVALSPGKIEALGNWPEDGGVTHSTDYAIFGEVEATEMATSNDNGVSDTGIKQRALLPFNETSRASLRSFRGPTIVMTSRASCVRPSINATLTADKVLVDNEFLMISGHISYEETFKGSNGKQNPECVYDDVLKLPVCLPTIFNCTVFVGRPESSAETLSDWSASACHVPVSALERDHDPPIVGSWNRDMALWDPRASWPWLVMATNVKMTHLEALEKSDTDVILGTPVAYEHWNSYEVVDSTAINITLCMTALNTSLAHVELTSNVDKREPKRTLDPTTNKLDPVEIQSFLDATTIHESAEDRGLLSMTKVEYLESTLAQSGVANGSFAVDGAGVDTIDIGSLLYHNSLAFASNTKEYILFLIDRDTSYSLIACILCNGWGSQLSEEDASLFSRIINTNSRAAVALDTLLLHMVMSWYYRIFPILDVSSEIEVAFSSQHIIPLHWNGLIAIISTVAVHIVGVWIITVLYLVKIRYTRQGNIWHTISQLVSEQTLPILEYSNELRDKDVANLLKGKDQMVKIGRSETGRVQVM